MTLPLLSGADWGVKFKRALDLTDQETKRRFDTLIEIRRQLRNFLAHGAFGKDGETLDFHSSAGAVPVLLDVGKRRAKFSVGERLEFDPAHAFLALQNFIAYLSTGSQKPAWLYIQEFGLPLIMTMARDGTYQNALSSCEAMEEFALDLAGRIDNSNNMDW